MVSLKRFASLMLAVVIGGSTLLATAPSVEAQQTQNGYRVNNSDRNRSGWSNRGSYGNDEQYNHRGRTFQGDNFGGFDVAPAGQFQQKYNRSKQLRRGGFGDRLSQNGPENQNLATLMAGGQVNQFFNNHNLSGNDPDRLQNVVSNNWSGNSWQNNDNLQMDQFKADEAKKLCKQMRKSRSRYQDCE